MRIRGMYKCKAVYTRSWGHWKINVHFALTRSYFFPKRSPYYVIVRLNRENVASCTIAFESIVSFCIGQDNLTLIGYANVLDTFFILITNSITVLINVNITLDRNF